ncbi:UDP-3-O-acyl-N-acetylglucosamine deacetylase [Tropicimonas sp. IMCC34011]|uniref:UDP-3-O-acyl-N-acetylglucosamine deacetylase n=1 Tax=Tropicimonas sp. IMCC34011 TaxID=2248759 RepID=UPI000E232CA2|nr:UDP-3-O-acyl-N-acetylglucosamine deacetylase [Tropicimonas sp. IMCC34011]
MQTTLHANVTLDGVGLHSGAPVRLTLRPAEAGTGIRFRRVDVLPTLADIPARWDLVEPTPLCTRLVNESGTSISTVEHVMAALAGCGVHNAVVEVSGPEVPILDGSAAPFAEAILDVGLVELDAPLKALRILRPVEVRSGAARARLAPADHLHISFDIDFPDRAIGAQSRRLDMANGAFLRELCDSRTFCRAADVEAMRARGQALGGTYFNAVVVDGERILSPGGLRHRDEPVRHKMLDALGDLALAGAPILGAYEGVRAGHTLTNQLLRRLFSVPGAVDIVTCDAGTLHKLPGAGVRASDLRAVA